MVHNLSTHTIMVHIITGLVRCVDNCLFLWITSTLWITMWGTGVMRLS
jgi:hypothetical protein